MKKKTAVVLVDYQSGTHGPYGRTNLLLSLNNRPWAVRLVMCLHENGFERIIFKSKRHQYELQALFEQCYGNGDLKLEFSIGSQPSMLNDVLSDIVPSSSGLMIVGNQLTTIPFEAACDTGWYLYSGGGHDRVDETILAVYFHNAEDAQGRDNSISLKLDNDVGMLQSFVDTCKDKVSMHGIAVSFPVVVQTIDEYHRYNKTMICSREFNEFTLTSNNTLIKKSQHDISCEYEYYREMQEKNIEFLFPQMISKSCVDKKYEINYLDYQTLSYLFVYGGIQPGVLTHVIQEIVDMLKKNLWSRKGYVDKSMLLKIYVDKTLNRLNEWSGNEILKQKSLVINRNQYPNFDSIWDQMLTRISKLIDTSEPYHSIIHGDPVFTNILVSNRVGIVKFLDPRGNFGEDTIYGDLRYDIAKIRQCYHGKYDYIINGLFRLEHLEENRFNYHFFPVSYRYDLDVDRIFEGMGMDIDTIRVIEALLFFSMIPLHVNKDRQIMFFLRGCETIAGDLEN